MDDEKRQSDSIRKLDTSLHLSPDVRARNGSFHSPDTSRKQITDSGLQHPPVTESPVAANASPPLVALHVAWFAFHFLYSGCLAAMSKTGFAGVEKVKLFFGNNEQRVKTAPISTQVIRYFPTQAFNFAFKEQYKKLLNSNKPDSYGKWFAGNVCCGGAAGASSHLFVYPLDYARTLLANHAKMGAGERRFNGLVDVYKKTRASDGIAGLYRGFKISCVGAIVYRGLYFGIFDSLSPLLVGGLGNDEDCYALGLFSTYAAGLASYPIEKVHRRMMTTSSKSSLDAFTQIVKEEGARALFKVPKALPTATSATVLAWWHMFTKEYVKAHPAKNMKKEHDVKSSQM